MSRFFAYATGHNKNAVQSAVGRKRRGLGCVVWVNTLYLQNPALLRQHPTLLCVVMKDLFSTGSQRYQQARPSYPTSVIQALLEHLSARDLAWDCGAGSGQFTQVIAPYFEHVVATDLSPQQLQQAPRFDNVSYQVQAAEKTCFEADSFDLISVAQAIHWFDFERFYAEVYRCLKPDGLFAVIGYGLIEVQSAAVNQEIQMLYTQRLKDHWDPERIYIDQAYQNIPFPFQEIATPAYEMDYQWSAVQLLNYLKTWSAVKHYQKHFHDDPLQGVVAALAQTDALIEVRFPVFLRLGRRA